MPMKSKGRTGPTGNDKSERLLPRAKSGYHGTGDVNNSYRYSKEQTAPTGRPKSRHGFSRNPKQNSDGPYKSEAFPRNYDAAGVQPGVKGVGGMARNQVTGSGGKAKQYDHGEPVRRNPPNTGY